MLEASLWVGGPKLFVGDRTKQGIERKHLPWDELCPLQFHGQERQVGLSFRRHCQHLVPEVLPSLQRELWKHHPADRQAVSRYNPCL